MVTIIAKFKIQPGKEQEAEEAMKAMASSVESDEAGALAYIFLRNKKEPTEISVFEIYADGDAFDTHRSTPHMATFGSKFGTLFDPATVKIERLEQVAGFKR